MYTEIFQDIVAIMHHDYSGCLDKKDWDQPIKYAEIISKLEEENSLTPIKFIELVNDYLLYFRDRHIFFKFSSENKERPKDNGFTVRRYQDKLYVTHAGKERRIRKGDAIVSIDDMTIPQLLKKYGKWLEESTPDRERWSVVLSRSAFCKVMDSNSKIRMLDLQSYERDQTDARHTIEKLDEEVLLLTLTDFASPDVIVNLVKEHKHTFNNCRYLIVDVRVNYGGSDTAFLELLPYLFEEGPISLPPEEKAVFNCTEHNYQLASRSIKEYLSQIEDGHAKKVLNVLLREWERNRGKGFVEFDLSEITSSFIPVNGKTKPERVIVLSDVTCGSAGDSFVEISKLSPKVTVIGRPTLGVNDYANLEVMEWKGFELWYPTSRLSRIDKGEGMSGIGIKPHIYIPWTSEHIFKDVDLEMALEELINH